MQFSKVVVGLSGGVDSSVSAYLLQQAGFDVEAVFMKNWEEDDTDVHCSAAKDAQDAESVCNTLGIPFHRVNFAAEYWDDVFAKCLDDFKKGITPNPDILCNRHIKFKMLLDFAKTLGADALATGHYAETKQQDGLTYLLKGQDPNKDQSYFLYALTQQQIRQALFPIGALTKPEVRKIASTLGLKTAAKKDSTGICFIGEKNFKPFLQRYLPANPGDIIDLDGNILGQHEGVIFYTIGQRQGLTLGGMKNREPLPWYVVGKNVQQNQLIVAQGIDHPSLYKQSLIADTLTFISGAPPSKRFACTAKIRYRQTDQPCHVTLQEDGQALVEFETPQRAITPGQSIVFYDGLVTLGGGVIRP